MPNLPDPETEEIEEHILAYLADHPDAQDTLEGIALWWILEHKTLYQTAQIAHALKRLVQKGVLEEKVTDADFGRKHYRAVMNREKGRITPR